MNKIIKIENGIVFVGDSLGNFTEIPFENFGFDPQVGDFVEFYKNGETYIVSKVNLGQQVTPTTTQKSKMVAGLLAFFLRPFYFFYIGSSGKGVLHLFIAALSLFPPFLVVNLIWNIVLGILILTSKPGTKYHQDALGNELLD